MSTPYINNNQGLGFRYDSPIRYMEPRVNNGLGSVPLAPKNQNFGPRVVNSPERYAAPRTDVAKFMKDTPSKSDSSSLGSWWQDAKEYTMGTSVPTMSKNVGGKFDKSFWNDTEWKMFEDQGGYFNDKGQLFDKNGNAFDVTKISGDRELEALGKSTEGGLFSGEGLDRVGKAAENAGRIFSAYQAADNIFGRGAKSRREAERQMKKDFEQRYAMNQMTMDKFREDNAQFKQQRAAITASY